MTSSAKICSSPGIADRNTVGENPNTALMASTSVAAKLKASSRNHPMTAE